MNSPLLRFKGFESNWVSEKFNSLIMDGIIDKPMDGNHGETHPKSSDYVVKGIPFVMANDIVDQAIDFDRVSRISKEQADKLRKGFSYEGDVLLTHKGTIGNTAIVPNLREPYIMLTPQVTYYRIIDKTRLKKQFLKSFFESSRYKKDLEIAASSGTRPYVGITEQATLKFVYPEIEEQHKIADFLSAVDKKISLLKQKHSLLKQYKKGVMQQLFSQQIRFKDDYGKAFPDWQEFQLQDIATPIKRKATKAINNVMTISAGRGFLHQADRFSQIIAGTSLDKYTLLKKNEFAYNRGNSKKYTYGCIYKLENHEEALVPFVYRSFSLDKGVPEFYEHLFEHKYLDRQLRRLISSSARMDGLLNIGEKAFYKVKLPFPCEQEQIKIAEFITALNKKINLAAKQIELTQTFKKGLLQQMFV